MQIDFYAVDTGVPEGFRVEGSITLVDGRVVVAGDEGLARFLADWVVVKPGHPDRRLTPDDGLEYMQAVPYNLRSTYSWAGWNHIGLNDNALEASLARIRRAPAASTVERSLPVLFFGDFLTARAVTIALNPSDQEYLAKDGSLLAGARQRFATIDTYGRESRAELTDPDCLDALSWMRGYFLAGSPIYRYFGHLKRFLDGAGHSYTDGSAAHLDLVQESTREVWRDLPEAERANLLSQDLPFLELQLLSRPLEAVFCNGRTVSDTLRQRFSITETDRGEEGKLRWWAGRIELHSAEIPIAGWNYPLNQATGLDGEGERAFGRFIAEKLPRQT